MSKTQEEPGEVSEASVYRRYAAAANQREAALCCPDEYAANFFSVTVVAYKGKQGPCLERNQAVVYRGPFKKVVDDATTDSADPCCGLDSDCC